MPGLSSDSGASSTSDLQPFYHLLAQEVFSDDIVDVFRVDESVPALLWVYHHHWAVFATPKTTGFVDANFALDSEAKSLDLIPHIVQQLGGAMIIAAPLCTTALVAAYKYVLIEKAHDIPCRSGRRAALGVAFCPAADTNGGGVVKLGVLPDKGQSHHTSWSVTVLAYDDFGQAAHILVLWAVIFFSVHE